MKNGNKIAENLGRVMLTVGDDLGECFQGPRCNSKYRHLSKNSQKITAQS
jgi:hypothetical protein